MRRTLAPLFAWIVAVVFLASCGGGSAPKHVNLIPKDAAVVASIDVKQLVSKSVKVEDLFSKESLKEMGASEKEAEQGASTAKEILNSGVDYLNKGYFFVKGEDNVGLVFAIDDAKKFEAFLKNESFWKDKSPDKKAFEVKKADKMKYAFKKDVLIAFSDNSGLMLTQKKASEDDLKAAATKIFEQKSEETLMGTNDNFKKSVSNSFDMALWVNAKKTSEMNEVEGSLPGGFSLDDTYFMAGANFEKGKVVIDAKTTVNEKTANIYKKVGNSKGVNSKIVKNVAVEDPVGAMSLSLNLKGLKDVLKEQGLLGNLDAQLSAMGLSSDDVFNTFSGDVVVAVKSLDMRKGMPEFVLGLGISDKASFEKIVKAVDKGGMLSKKDNIYEVQGGMGYIIEKDGAIYGTATASIKDAIVKGDGKLKSDMADEMKDKSMMLYINEKLISQAKGMLPIGMIIKDTDELPMQSFTLSSKPIDGKEAEAELIIEMKDKDKNALMVMIDKAKESNKKDLPQ